MAKVCCFMCLYKHIQSTLDETVACTLVSNYLIHALDNLNKIAINFCLVLICFIMLIYLFLYNVYFKLVLRFTLSWWYVDMLVFMLIFSNWELDIYSLHCPALQRMSYYGAPTVDKGSFPGQPGYPASGYPQAQPGLVPGISSGSSLTQPRYPGPAGAMPQQYAGVPMSTTAQAMQGYSSISGYPAGNAPICFV